MARLNKEGERKNMLKDLEVESPEKEPTEAEVKAFVERNLRECDPQNPSFSVICVDGRYDESNHKKDAIAAPGGHLGLGMALQDIRLGFEPAEAFELVRDFLRAHGEQFTWHSDDHVGMKGHGEDHVGCGHCNAAIKSAHQYGVQGEKVAGLLKIIQDNQEASDIARKNGNQGIMSYAELTGKHAEEGILLINSDHFTVEHSDSQNQYFGYDKQRYDAFLKKFVTYALEVKGLDIDLDVLLSIIEQHTTATLGLLGSSKGKPIFEVTITEDGEVTVKKIANAPDHTK